MHPGQPGNVYGFLRMVAAVYWGGVIAGKRMERKRHRSKDNWEEMRWKPKEETKEYPAKLTSGYYRVCKTRKDSKSQVGAYRILANAKATADKNPGTFVFTNDGVAIHLVATKVEETYRVHTVVKGDTLWEIAKKYLGNGSR